MKKMYAVTWYDELDSTNNEAIRKAGSLDNMSVIAASHQTAGRGPRGNAWHAEAGENLTFSIFLRFRTPSDDREGSFPEIMAADQFVLSETATLAQCRFLKRKGIDARIKWPNDIYAGNRKISGMLVENSLNGKYLATSVIGIGLNVNQTCFPPELPNPTSMSLLTGSHYELRTLLGEFMEVFTETVLMMNGIPHEELKELYEMELYRKGEQVMFLDISGRPAYLPANPVMSGNPGGRSDETYFTGTVKGVSDTGMLQVMLPDGRVREFGFKEIAYVIR